MTKHLSSYFLLAAFLVPCFYSCKPKMVCPAYHSAFILGEEDQQEFFSNFEGDSFPEIKDELRSFMEKNKYGIVVEVSKKKKMRLLDFVSMETVFPLIDSTMLDSTGSLPQPGYNRDMMVYNRKFGERLREAQARWELDAKWMEENPEGVKKKKKKKPKAEEDEDEDEFSDDDFYLDADDEW